MSDGFDLIAICFSWSFSTNETWISSTLESCVPSTTLLASSSLTYMVVLSLFIFLFNLQGLEYLSIGIEKLHMGYPILVLLWKYQAFLLQALLGSQLFFGKELMLRLSIMTLFIFSVLGFIHGQRYSIDLREFWRLAKFGFCRNFALYIGPITSSKYISIFKERLYFALCQTDISISELWKSTSKSMCCYGNSFFWVKSGLRKIQADS